MFLLLLHDHSVVGRGAGGDAQHPLHPQGDVVGTVLADDVVDNDSAEEEEVDNDERDLDPEEGTLWEEGREIMELVGEHKVEVDDDKDEDGGDP